jgi:SpoVK/Ycf46/Vps4 family AAA+-type ATPase
VEEAEQQSGGNERRETAGTNMSAAPNAEFLKTLIEFGYPEQQAVRALRATDNAGIEQAAEWLANNPALHLGGAGREPAPSPAPTAPAPAAAAAAPAPAPAPRASAASSAREAAQEAARLRYIEEQKRKKAERKHKDLERKRLDEQRAIFAARQGKLDGTPAAAAAGGGGGGGGAAAAGGGAAGGGMDELAALRAERAKQHSERVEREKARQAKEDRDAREAEERQTRNQADRESQVRHAEQDRKRIKEQQRKDREVREQMRREESDRRDQLRRDRETKEQQQAAVREQALRQQAAQREEMARQQAAAPGVQRYSAAAATALLCSVGFGEEQVTATLREKDGNIRSALEALLRSGAVAASPDGGARAVVGAADADGQWWGTGAIEREAHGILLRLAKGRRHDFKQMRQQRGIESREKCRSDHEDVLSWTPQLPMTRDLDWKLGWADLDRGRYADFRVKLNDIVGMEPVMELIVDTIHDAVGRKGSDELGGAFHYRHMLLSGAEGTGKKTAADVIGHLCAVVGAVNDPNRWEPQQTKYFIPLSGLGDLDPDTVGEKCVYYVQQPGPPSAADALVLQTMIERGSFAILGGTHACLQKWMRQPVMKRDDRSRLIELPSLGVPELAAITVQLVEEAGYQLGTADGKAPEMSGHEVWGGLDKSVMEYIVRQTYNDAAIRENNANLAATMIQRAITRKNARVEREGLGAGRLTLTPQDFGVEMQTDEELQAIKQEVQEEVERLWGVSSSTDMEGVESETDQAEAAAVQGLLASSPMEPVAFFTERLKMKLGEVTSELAAGKARRDNWNVLVTGSGGVGKLTFAKLLARYLKACRILPRDAVVKKQVGELQDEETKKLLVQGGCLVINIDSLLGGAFSGRDTIDPEQAAAVKSVLAATAGKPVVCVLCGKWDTASRLLQMDAQMDSGIVISLPRQVHIADYSPEKVATIAEDLARVEKDCSFEEGLWEKLAAHIAERYEDMGNAGNGRLARKLVENADRWREERVFSSTMRTGGAAAAASQSLSQGEADGGAAASAAVAEEVTARCFIASDFNMDAKLVQEQLKGEVDKDIQDLIGMDEAKVVFQAAKAKVRYVEKTGDKSALKTCLNLVITGNPGTGKTMFSRLLYRFMRAYGILKSDHEVFVERNGLELKGQFLGDTAPKVKRAVRDALGGCLFIDEAYALAEGGQDVAGGGDAFAKDAVRTLLTEVENNRTSVMVVLAGYKDKMARLMRMDPGLDRRFPQRLHLRDYSKDQLAEVCEIKARGFGRTFEPGLREKLSKHIGDFYHREIPQQNAGLALNLTEKAIDQQIERLVAHFGGSSSLSQGEDGGGGGGSELERTMSWGSVGAAQMKEMSRVLTADDFGISEQPTLGDEEEKAQVLAEVDAMIGMENIKEYFRNIEQSVRYVEQGGNFELLKTSLNMVITGNPGTGKTTVARMVARYLHAFGILPRDRFVEKNGLDLKGKYLGHTSHTVKEAIADAMGGCLFLDEAYALVDGGGDGFSSEAVRTLLTEVENNRTNLLVVLAGYEDKMLTNEDSLMKTDPGLPRRFATTLHLEDYSPAELALIAEKAARERFELQFEEGLLEDLAAHIVRVHSADVARQNGGLAINLTEQAFRRLAKRVVVEGLGMSPAAQVLVAADFAIGVVEQAAAGGGAAAATDGAGGAADAEGLAEAAPPPAPSFGTTSYKRQALVLTPCLFWLTGTRIVLLTQQRVCVCVCVYVRALSAPRIQTQQQQRISCRSSASPGMLAHSRLSGSAARWIYLSSAARTAKSSASRLANGTVSPNGLLVR